VGAAPSKLTLGKHEGRLGDRSSALNRLRLLRRLAGDGERPLGLLEHAPNELGVRLGGNRIETLLQ